MKLSNSVALRDPAGLHSGAGLASSRFLLMVRLFKKMKHYDVYFM